MRITQLRRHPEPQRTSFQLARGILSHGSVQFTLIAAVLLLVGVSTAKCQVSSKEPVEHSTDLDEARMQATRKQFPHAEKTVRAYLEKHPDSAQGHFLLGYILNAEHEPKRSLEEYTIGSRFHRPSAADLLVVAADYVYLHDYADADKWFTMATQWSPGDALAWYFLGRTKYNENRFKEAINTFERCLQLDPRNTRAENNLGLSYEGLADDNNAQRAYLTAIQWESNLVRPDPQPYLNLGMLLAREGHNRQAILYLRKAVELAPGNPKAREQLGRAYEKMHMLSKAQSELEKAVVLAPGVSALHFQLGRIYHEEKNEGMAKKEFATCATLNGSKSTDADETPNPDNPH